jgi:TRAP-type C4-dicarboxylate transport system permease small subunit
MLTATVFARWLHHRAENVIVALLLTMFMTFILQIFFRYVLDNPLGWTEEVIIATWLWVVLWGAAFVIGETEEIRFDILYSNISERLRRIFTVITGVVLIVIYSISLPATYKYVSFMKVEHSAYLRVPLDWLYSIYLFFAIACICRYCWLVWRALKGMKSPQADPTQFGD